MAAAERFSGRALVGGFRSARFIIIITPAARGMTKEYYTIILFY